MLKYIKLNEGKGKVTIRDLASKFNVSIGTAAADRTQLIKEHFLNKSCNVTREGDQILFEIWPDKFKEPMELDLVQNDDLPFWTIYVQFYFQTCSLLNDVSLNHC